jgi:UDP-N-acetylmuramyl pentapeptide phosphotransferase/UDP-N-acetylglucosamine-1-phosphate transferase
MAELEVVRRTTMPAWIIVYVILFLVLSTGGLWDDYQEHRPVWHLMCTAVATIVITVLFISRWYPSLRPAWSTVTQIAFVAAITWELFVFVSDLRSIRPDPDLTSREQTGLALFAVVAVSAISLPAFVVAGVEAFNRQ